MTLNAVMTLILRFSPNSTDFQVHYIIVVEDRPIMSVKYCLPVPVFHGTFIQNYNTPCRGSWASCFSKEWGQFGPNFQVQLYKGSSPTNYSSYGKTRWIEPLYGISILAEVSFALSQFTRLTDEQAKGRTHISANTALHSMQRSNNVPHALL